VNHSTMAGMCSSKVPGAEKFKTPARSQPRFSKSWVMPPGTRTNPPHCFDPAHVVAAALAGRELNRTSRLVHCCCLLLHWSGEGRAIGAERPDVAARVLGRELPGPVVLVGERVHDLRTGRHGPGVQGVDVVGDDVDRLRSGGGDLNSRPLRPERSAVELTTGRQEAISAGQRLVSGVGLCRRMSSNTASLWSVCGLCVVCRGPATGCRCPRR
jgi:hypothetical protein